MIDSLKNKHSFWFRYGAALLIVVLATIVRAATFSYFGQTVPFLLFYPAVIITALFWGFGPGLLASGLTALASCYWIEPVGSLAVVSPALRVGVVTFVIINIALVWICERVHRATRHAAQAEAARKSEEALVQQAEVLRAGEERFRAIFDNAGMGMIEAEKNEIIIAVNDRACEILGYRREELIGMTADELTAPEDREISARLNAELHAGVRKRNEYEKRYLKRDGSPLWVHVAVTGIRDTAGHWFRGLATFEDITERKRAEEALHQNRNMLAHVLNSVPQSIFWKDRNSVYLGCNEVFAQAVGIAKLEEIVGKTDFDLPWPRHEAEAYIADDKEVMENNRPKRHIIESLQQADGNRFLIDTTKVPLTDSDGHVYGILGVYEDVTERKQAEEQLRLRESFLSAITENQPGLLWLKDSAGRFLMVNKAFATACGRESPEQVNGLTDWDIWPKELAEKYRNDDQRVMLIGNSIIEEEAIFIAGHRIWYETFKTPVRDGTGRVIGTTGYARDITERRQAEDKLKASMLSAEKAKEAAEEASRAKDRFLAILSHELRTPLTPILALTSALAEDESLGDTLCRDLKCIERNIELEAHLIDDLLDVTRIIHGKIRLDKRPVDLREIIRRVVDICQEDIKARRIHFGVKTEDKPYPILADATRLQQVFWNLLENAIKFTPETGYISIQCHRTRQSVVAEVTDSGKGIAAEDLDRIFNPFEQVERRETGAYGGLGLGLSLSKSLVELHEGTIEAKSEGLGEGSTFCVTLPLTEESLPVVASPPIPSAPVTPRVLRILVVEDHEDTARILARLLRSQGHEVRTARNMNKALELSRQWEFDLLISDLGLPDGNGRDLMRQLRSIRPKALGIAISGFGTDEDIHQSLVAGFEEHLVKPLDIAALRAVILRMASNVA